MPPAAESMPPVHHAKNFVVDLQGLNVKLGYFTQVTGFSSQVDVLEYAEGGQNTFVHRLPTRTKQGNITLKRGVITDDKTLVEWYQKTVVMAQAVTLVITLRDTADKPIRTWNFRNAYPIKWTGGDMNAGGTEFLTESLEVAHNGFTVT
jgi:phage tail-like protein